MHVNYMYIHTVSYYSIQFDFNEYFSWNDFNRKFYAKAYREW